MERRFLTAVLLKRYGGHGKGGFYTFYEAGGCKPPFHGPHPSL